MKSKNNYYHQKWTIDTRINDAETAHSVIFAASSAQIDIVYVKKKKRNLSNEGR